MSDRDRVDDRKPEPRSVLTSGAVGAAEALEGMRQELGREPAAAVDDVELDRAVRRGSREPNGAFSVMQRVVDQVLECLLDPPLIGADDEARAVLHRQLAPALPGRG